MHTMTGAVDVASPPAEGRNPAMPGSDPVARPTDVGVVQPAHRKPILVAYDGSPSARSAASWAAAEAASTGRPLRLAHVLRWPLPELEGLRLPATVLDVGRARKAALNLVETGVDECRRSAPGVDVRGEELTGSTVDLLATLAADAHMLVLGASGQTASPRVLLGSSAAELTRRVTSALVVVREAITPHGGVRRVVIGVDGSAASAAAVRCGFDAAARRGFDVIAVHAWCDLPIEALGTGIGIEDELVRRDGAALLAEQLVEARRQHPEVGVREVVTLDRPTRALLEHAGSAALLVVGRHGRARGHDTPLGSVSHALLHYAHCPVLLAA